MYNESMKKYYIFALVAVLVLILAGCNPEVTAAQPPVTETVTSLVPTTITAYVPTTVISTVTTTLPAITETITTTLSPVTTTEVTTPAVMPVITYINMQVGTYSDDSNPEPNGSSVIFTFYDSKSNVVTFEDNYKAHLELWTEGEHNSRLFEKDYDFTSAEAVNEIRVPSFTRPYNYVYKLTIAMSDGKVFKDEWSK